MSQTSLLPPRISFAVEATADVEALDYGVPGKHSRRRYVTVTLDGVLSIRHPGGRARIRIAALELRQATPGRWQLHVLNFDHGKCLGTSRGIYLVLSDEEAAEAHAAGVPKREKPALPRSWKPGVVPIRDGGDAPKEETGSLRGPHGIAKSSSRRGYVLVDLATGEALFRHRRRNACETESDRLLSIGQFDPRNRS